jgi:uncharacterized protein (TIGR02996 family)
MRDVELVVDRLEVLLREIDQQLPEAQGLGVAALQLHHPLPRALGKGLVTIELPSRRLVEARQLAHAQRRRGLFFAEIEQVLDEQAEGRAPVADVVVANDLVPREREQPRQGVADDRAPEVPDVHLLRDVRGRVVDDHALRRIGHGHAEPSVAQHRGGRALDEGVGERDVQKPRARDLDLGDRSIAGQRSGDRLGHRAWVLAEALAEPHGQVRLHVRVRRRAEEWIFARELGAERLLEGDTKERQEGGSRVDDTHAGALARAPGRHVKAPCRVETLSMARTSSASKKPAARGKSVATSKKAKATSKQPAAPRRRSKQGPAPQQASAVLSPQALLAAVLAQPDDDAPRRAYANHPSLRKDPRGEFIAVQLSLAGSDLTEAERQALVEQEQALLEEHGSTWCGPLRNGEITFRRGFIERVACAVNDFTSARPQPEPIRALSVKCGCNSVTAAQLAQSPHLATLSSLRFGGCTVGARGAAALAKSPHLAGLTELDLGRNNVGRLGAKALAKSPHLAALTSLDLRDNELGDEGALAIAHSPHLTRLTSLDLTRNDVGAAGAMAIAQSPQLTNLTSLTLRSNSIGDAGAKSLAESPHLAHLTSLSLRSNGIGKEGVVALVQSEVLAHVTSLDLQGNHVSQEGAEALAGSPHLAHLTHLQLSDTAVGPEGCVALANSPRLAGLVELGLAGCAIGEEGATALAQSSNLAHVTELDLSGNKIGDAGALALAQSAQLAHVTSLRLDRNQIGAQGALALARSPHLGRITRLYLNDNQLDEQARKAIRARWPLAQA